MLKFGAAVNAIWPEVNANSQPISKYGLQLLEQCTSVQKPNAEATVDVKAFMRKSTDFPRKFTVDTCRVMSQPKTRHEVIGKQISSVYPLIHERTLGLYLQYLEHKTELGTDVEKRVYSKLSLCDFVQRLLAKRCVSFYGRNDTYLLVTGESGAREFEPIGSDKEKPPLVLENVLSYDDVKLSALLSVSSHSEFINRGERTNCGRVLLDRTKLEPEGVIIGLIGARFTRRNYMEYEDIIISRTQNTKEQGYGVADVSPKRTRTNNYRQIFRNFYETNDHLHAEVSIDEQRFGVPDNKQDIFDNLVMKRRYAISFDVLLLEAQARAAKAGKQAYIHVVGFGLGVWKVAPQQEQIFLETFEQRLNVLSEQLTHIGVVHFSWFHMSHCGELHDGALLKFPKHPKGGIRVHLSKRNPADKLASPEHDNMLLVVSYAWDGNALPGNEYWMGMIKSTGDSSTACSTLVTELHNPHINTDYCNGQNLHIVSLKYGVIHIAEYAKHLLAKNE